MLEGHSSSADLCRQATQAVPPLAAGLCLAGEVPSSVKSIRMYMRASLVSLVSTVLCMSLSDWNMAQLPDENKENEWLHVLELCVACTKRHASRAEG